jgi:hypothetical protein
MMSDPEYRAAQAAGTGRGFPRRGFLRAAGAGAAGGTLLGGFAAGAPAALAASTADPNGAAARVPARIEYAMPRLTFGDPATQDALGSVYESALTNVVGINTAYAQPSTYNLANRVTYPPGTFAIAGQGYQLPQRWTRDSAVNAWNAISLIAPAVGRNTLWSVVDPRSGGGLIVQQNDREWWDQIVWLVSAWNHFLITGDNDFLADAYDTSVNTMAVRKSQNFNSGFGLFEGPGFMNDGISAYPGPPWKPGIDSSAVLDYPGADTLMCLSTNCLYYGAYQALAGMARALGKNADAASYEAAAGTLKSSINRGFWRASAGTYGYLIQGAGSPGAGQLDDHQEGGGLALAILLGIATPAQARSVLATTHWQPYGVVNVWPNFPRFTGDEWGRQASLWPMVFSMFGHAAALGGRADLFARAVTQLAQLVRGTGGHFYEIYNSVTGAEDGGWQTDGSGQLTHWVSQPDQTWSATGFLRMIYRGLFGLGFTQPGLRFAPSLPPGWGPVSLTGLPYRDMTLDITLTGAGDFIQSVTVDGRRQAPLLPATGSGHHQVEITLGAAEQRPKGP